MARKINEELRERIFQAAEKCFTQRGFHGVSIREIAGEADTSLSNIYAHFESKEILFRNILQRYEKEYFRQANLTGPLEELKFPELLENLGEASKGLIRKFENYIRLIYVDVVEFQGLHISRVFSHMRERYEKLFGPALKKLQKEGLLREDFDPVVALMTVTMAYFNYFTVEYVFGAKRHFGLGDKKVIKEIARIFTYGMVDQKAN